MHFSLFLFLVFFLFPQNANSQSTPSASKSTIFSSLQNIDFHLASLEFKFEEDLFVKSLVECPDDEQEEPSCSPCNYSGPVDSSGLCVDPTTDLFPDLPSCECNSHFCSEGGPLLEAGRTYKFDSFGYFNTPFQYNHEPRDQGFEVNLNLINGSSEVTLTVRDEPNHDDNNILALTKGHNNVFVCPSDPRFARTYTFFIFVYSTEIYSEYKFELTINVVKNTFSPPPFSPLNYTVLEPHFCYSSDYDIEDSSFLFSENFPSDECNVSFLIFPLKYPSCRTISVIVENVGLNIFIGLRGGLFQRWELLSMPNNSSFQYELQNLRASPIYYQSGDNVFSLCPESTSNFSDTLFAIEMPELGMSRIFVRDVTENPEVKSRVIGSLSPLIFQEYLFDSIVMSCPCYSTDNCDEPIPFWPGWNELVDEVYLTNETSPDFARRFSLQGDRIAFRCFSDLFWDYPYPCYISRVIPVLESFNPLIYPMLEIARDQRIYPFYSPYLAETKPILNDTIGFLIQLQTKSEASTTVLSAERFEVCDVRFVQTSRLHTSSGEPPSMKAFEVKEMEQMSTECDGTQFAEVVDKVSDLYPKTILLAVLPSDRPASYYYISVLTATREYFNCVDKLSPFYEKDTPISITNSRHCFEYDASDPCCNSTLEWTNCCIPSDRVQVSTTSSLTINNTYVDLNCPHDECATDVLFYLQGVSLQSQVQRDCENINRFESVTTTAKECSDRWFGDPQLGYPCDSDSVCEERFDQGECDISVGRCINVREVMETNFLECLYFESSPFARTLFFLFFNLTESNFFEYFWSEDEIVSDYGPMSPCKNSVLSMSHMTDISSCPSCDKVYCLLTSICDIPFQCLDYSSICNPTFTQLNPLCPNNKVCNWDKNQSETECVEEEYVCMYCYNSSHCVGNLDLTTKEACESTPVCVLPDEVFFDVTEEECQLMVDSDDEEDGYCNDPDFIEETILRVNESFTYLENPILESLDGVCYFPLSPDNFPSCPYRQNFSYYSLDFSTRRGCVVYSRCFFDFFPIPLSCTQILQSKSECEKEGGKWLSFPIDTKEECEDISQLYCEDPIRYTLRIPRPRDQLLDGDDGDGDVDVCEKCDQIRTKPATWVQNKANRYKYTTPKWARSQMVPIFYSNTRSLDFQFIDTSLTTVDNGIESLNYGASARCYYTLAMEPATYLTGSCLSDEEFTLNNTEDTFFGIFDPENDPYSPVSFGFGLWCPGMEYRVLLANGILTFGSLSTSSLICGVSNVYLTYRSQFVGNRTIVPTSLFGNPNLLDPDPVRNEMGASVGVVASDGFFFCDNDELNSVFPNGTFYNVTVLVYPPSKDENDKYTVYDFGFEVLPEERYRKNELELRPMDVSVELKSDSINRTIAVATISREFVSNSCSRRTFLIRRIPDYSEQKVDRLLGDGEETLLYVFSGLYGASFLIVFGVLLVIGFLMFSFSNVLMVGLGSGMLCIRSIYIGMYGAGYLQGQSGGEILMVEIPSFLYLALGGLVVSIFSFTYQNVSGEKIHNKRPFWIRYFIFCGMLVVIFVIVIVLMVEIPDDGEPIYSCFGFRAEYQTDDSIENIRIAYHSLALFVAILCAGRLFVLSKMIYNQVQSKKVMLFAWIVGLGILCQNIMWVTYSALNGSSPYLVIPMFFVEALPVLFVALLAIPKKNYRRLYMIRKTSGTSSGET